MLTIKAIYSNTKAKYYVGVFDQYGRLVTFDIKVWLPLASDALHTRGYDDTRNALIDGAQVTVGGVKK